MVKFVLPLVLILSLLLCVFFWLSQETDETSALKTHSESSEHLYKSIAAAAEQWIIAESTWEDEREFTYDWNGDGHPETLNAEFLGAGAQSHNNIVLRDGKSGKEIYSTYAFNAPFYGVCSRGDTAPVIFVRVLGDLKAVIEAPLDSIPCPAPPSEAPTATLLSYSYYRLISSRNGSYIDASGEYPGLLWKLIAENTLNSASEDLGIDEDLTEFFMLSLLYYQVRTGLSIPAEWLDAAMSGECQYSSDEILAMIRKYFSKREHLEKFFKLEKQSLLNGKS